MYGCVTWSPKLAHYVRLRNANHKMPLRYHPLAEWKREDHILFYAHALVKTYSKSTEATARRRRILFAGSVARMEKECLPKRVLFGRWSR